MGILKIEQVCAMTRLGRTTIWRRERAGDFPLRVRLGPASVGWVAEEIEAWIASRPRGTLATQPQAPSGVEELGGGW